MEIEQKASYKCLSSQRIVKVALQHALISKNGGCFIFEYPLIHEAKSAYKSGYLSVVSQQISYGIKCVFSGEKAKTSVEYF